MSSPRQSLTHAGGERRTARRFAGHACHSAARLAPCTRLFHPIAIPSSQPRIQPVFGSRDLPPAAHGSWRWRRCWAAATSVGAPQTRIHVRSPGFPSNNFCARCWKSARDVRLAPQKNSSAVRGDRFFVANLELHEGKAEVCALQPVSTQGARSRRLFSVVKVD
jgi:hypothetical protein